MLKTIKRKENREQIEELIRNGVRVVPLEAYPAVTKNVRYCGVEIVRGRWHKFEEKRLVIPKELKEE